jgi:hypothetical protein
MMGKLATWLVVALVGGAFVVGLAGGAFVAGGGSSSRSTSRSQTTSMPATTRPVAAGTPAPTSPAAVRTISMPAPTSPAPPGTPARGADAPSNSGEPLEVEPSARSAIAGGVLSLLQPATASANSGETTASSKVLQELCVELVNALPLLAGGPQEALAGC